MFNSFVHAQAALVKSPDVIRKVLDQGPIQELNEVQAHGDARQWLQDKLTTDTLQSPEILRISLSGDRPDELATILDEVVKQYLNEYRAREDARNLDRSKSLLDNYKATAESLRGKRFALTNKLRDLGIEDPASTAARQSNLQQQVMANEIEGVRLKLKESEDKDQINAIRVILEHPAQIQVSASAVEEKVKEDLTYKFLFEDVLQADKELAKLRSQGTKGEWERKALAAREAAELALKQFADSKQAEVEQKLRNKGAEERRDELAKLEAKVHGYADQRAILDAQIKKLQKDIEDLRKANRDSERNSAELAPLQDAVSQTEMVLKRLGEELGAIQVDNANGSRVEVMDQKLAPSARKTDTQTKYAGVAALALFGLVFFGVVFWEYRHQRIYTATDVCRGVNLPVLGTMPRATTGLGRSMPTGAHGEYGPDQTALIEAIDGIRASLLHGAKTDHVSVVMVTSPSVGEGKTTLACHLAASLARSSRNTLLIDCDLRNPAANCQFGLPIEPGLCEALRGEIEYEEAILSTPIARLSLLPAGRADRLAIQCLAQENLGKVFNLLREQYEFIIIDVPPVLPVADSLLVGQFADAVIFSVLQNVSRLPDLHAALQRLTSLGIRVMGAVVTGDLREKYGYPRHAIGI
jgi:capsular exopolysaccharide synthesis family protein